jgi:hypothetical protein
MNAAALLAIGLGALVVVGQNSIRAKDGPSWGQSRTERGDAAVANRVGKMTGDESRPIEASADWRSRSLGLATVRTNNRDYAARRT